MSIRGEATRLEATATRGCLNRMAGDDAVGDFLAGEDDHGHAAAGVGAAAGEVEVAVFGARFGCFEPVVELPISDDTINAAAVGAIHALDVHGREQILDDDAVAQAGKSATLHFVDAAVFERDIVVVGDAGAVFQWRDVREDLDVVASGGSFAGVGAGGGDDVDGRVVG